MADRIEPIEDRSDRVLVTKIHTTDGDVILINTYMPSDGSHSDADYNSLLDEVYEIYQKYSTSAKVLWLGDMNASPERNKSKNDKSFAAFCSENHLTVSLHAPSEPTYHHFDGKTVISVNRQSLEGDHPFVYVHSEL